LVLTAVLAPSLLLANWEPRGPYRDDGSRFVISVRGGVAMPLATMRNDLGDMLVGIYEQDGGVTYAPDTSNPVDNPFDLIGTVDLGTLNMNGNFNQVSLAYGLSAGVVMTGNTNIRFEADWLRIEESSFSSNPLFYGDVDTTLGVVSNAVASARASMNSDIISAFVYYDFFEGRLRPEQGFIPYVGLGLGYASTKSVLMLSDPYGDFSGDVVMGNFGEQTGQIIDFYTSKTNNRNVALSAAIGGAYGLGQNVYFDIGARASYVPSVRFALNNVRDTKPNAGFKEMDIFSVRNLIFLNAYAGLRFEF